MVEAKDCIWLLRSLWRPNSSKLIQIPLLDTLLPVTGKYTEYMWLFADKFGVVRKKS